MIIQENISLKAFNTFGIDVKARYFTEVTTLEDLKAVLTQKEHPDKFILGGGSNMLLTRNIDALVVYINLKGIEVISSTEEEVDIAVRAGENWHEFVCWCIENNYGGLENLSLIPGNVGTAPIQNIGAYGVELKDVFISCHAWHKENAEEQVFSLEDCKFGYRDSVFKNELKGKYIITQVNFRLSRKDHKLNTSYGAIQQHLEDSNINSPTIRDVSEAVIAIRRSKLPDPKEIGNSGSFFKNPVISRLKFDSLLEKYPNMPSYRISDTEIKVPAGWLIEQCGFKGKRFGDAGIHERQALVLVNHGNASGKEIWQLATEIRATVKDTFDIDIEPEVNVI
ncbi:UDP-N-acetylmuramate dehydrogenase [Leptobacterium flavescens]|uniref:UDP-N-acetylenolpyruvoylglucosamine reductase n=1 Tax=Leptobacterium flavescens TaxID=472055 RepID=A0A6P0UJ11_9FLAO|nr:UDP-N-acetylmuramate dehydrogenase [Leptobacterium flavescens]NER12370.1 UDP-N-acetylmuramate dehydrogenase [Leptobacterium flavescens]